MKLQEEIWKDVVDYEGLYEVSSFGNVRSIRRVGTRGGVLKPRISNSGYYYVILHRDKQAKSMFVHRVVAKAFLSNPNNFPEVNHKDENKLNNCVDNLEFCTRQYNENYGTKRDRSVKSHNYKESSVKSALHHDYAEVGRKQSKKILQFDLDNNFIRSWDSLRQVGRELNVSIGNISSACNGRYRYAYGYIWKYAEQDVCNEKA